MPLIYIRLIGDLQVTVDGSPVVLPPSRRGRELLATLALAPTAMQSRARLAEKWWPGGSHASARASLTTELHKLRSALGAGGVALMSTRDEIGFSDLVSVDHAEFTEAVRRGENPSSIPSGELLPQLDAGWVESHRSRFRRSRSIAFRRKSSAALAGDDLETAVELAQEWVETHPQEDVAHQALVQALVRSGRSLEAHQAQERYADTRERAGVTSADGLAEVVAGRLASPDPDAPSDKAGTTAEDAAREVDRGASPTAADASPLEATRPGIPSGYVDLDDLIGELPVGLTVIAGQSRVGTTALLLGFARHAALALARPVAFFSPDVDEGEVGLRLLSQIAGPSLDHLRRGRVSWPKINSAMKQLSEAPFYVDDSIDISTDDIDDKVDALQREHGPFGLVVVDDLESINGGATASAETARQLRRCARTNRVPMVTAVRVDPNVRHRHDTRPLLRDIPACDPLLVRPEMIIALHRTEYYDEDLDADPETLELLVISNRRGPTGVCYLTLIESRGMLLSTAREHSGR